MSILQEIQAGADLKSYTIPQLEQLCAEIREELLRVVPRNGGHLSSNLGAVELTVALHYVYNLPTDKLLFDVGHQCYAHKMLTGRLDQFETLRRKDGLAGFPKPSESAYDAFGAGHSGTAISAALGYARAASIRGERYDCVALVGDGSFMDGPGIEAFNDAGRSELPLVVVLNDNNMSISRNVGALSNYLNQLRSNKGYWRFKSHTASFLKKIPGIGMGLHDFVYTVKNSIKYLFVHGQFFEALGFTYLGPIDGHNLSMLIRTLTRARNLERPVLVHAVTQKGHGYRPAEEKPDAFHGVAPYEVEGAGAAAQIHSSGVVSEALCRLGAEDDRVTVITAAMRDGTGTRKFAETYPKRFFDVGIAEEHAVTLAAGLAAGGVRPYFAVYSTFLQRGYDQMIHDVALQNLPVVFLCGLSEGIFPGKRANTREKLEEERRLCYVAFTRARDRLFLSDAAGTSYDGSFRYPSRFLFNAEKENVDYAVPLEPGLEEKTQSIVRETEDLGEQRCVPSDVTGKRVRHPVFGAGTVIGVPRDGQGLIVQFDGIVTPRTFADSGKVTFE